MNAYMCCLVSLFILAVAGAGCKTSTQDVEVSPKNPSSAATVTNIIFRRIALPERGGYERIRTAVVQSDDDLFREDIRDLADAIRKSGVDFQKEAVVVLPHVESSGSNPVKFSTPKVDGKRLICRIERKVPAIGTADMAYYCFILTVRKGAIQKVELSVEGQETGIQLMIPAKPTDQTVKDGDMQMGKPQRKKMHFKYVYSSGPFVREMSGTVEDPQGLWVALALLKPPPEAHGDYGLIGDDLLLGKENGYGLRQLGKVARKFLRFDTLLVEQPDGWKDIEVSSGTFTDLEKLNDTTLGWAFFDLRAKFEADLKQFLKLDL